MAAPGAQRDADGSQGGIGAGPTPPPACRPPGGRFRLTWSVSCLGRACSGEAGAGANWGRGGSWAVSSVPLHAGGERALAPHTQGSLRCPSSVCPTDGISSCALCRLPYALASLVRGHLLPAAPAAPDSIVRTLALPLGSQFRRKVSWPALLLRLLRRSPPPCAAPPAIPPQHPALPNCTCAGLGARNLHAAAHHVHQRILGFPACRGAHSQPGLPPQHTWRGLLPVPAQSCSALHCTPM